MKSKRRHDLEKNELAEWLAGTYKRFRPYEKLLLGTAIFALAVLLVYTVSSRYSAGRTVKGWNEFNEIYTPGASGTHLEGIVEEYPDSNVGHWAAVSAADAYLRSGSEQLFDNKADAYRDLKQAVDHYMSVLDKSEGRLIRERATWGLARAREALARDEKDLDRAAEEYKKVFTNWPEGAYAQVARQRYDHLKGDKAAELYRRFAKWEPKPAFQDEPGTPGERPAFDLDSLPDDAPLFEPSLELDLDGPSGALPELGGEAGAGDDEPQQTPSADAPQGDAAAPKETPAGNAGLEESPSADAVPEDAAPGNAAPTPEETAPEETAPEETAPEEAAPEQPAAPVDAP